MDSVPRSTGHFSKNPTARPCVKLLLMSGVCMLFIVQQTLLAIVFFCFLSAFTYHKFQHCFLQLLWKIKVFDRDCPDNAISVTRYAGVKHCGLEGSNLGIRTQTISSPLTDSQSSRCLESTEMSRSGSNLQLQSWVSHQLNQFCCI